jgi:glycosyltransferase involved in cell wall biosynthesis
MVNSLRAGGAEKHAVSLVNRLDVTRFRLAICSVKRDDVLAGELDLARLEAVWSLDVRRKFDWRAAARLARDIARYHIDIIVCTNEYPLLYATVACWLTRRPVRVVEVFHTTILRTVKSAIAMLLYRLLFRRCDLLIYVSFAQRQHWRARGLRAKRDVVIQNGIDTEYFTDRYTAAQKAQIRAEFGYSAGDYVIGICAGLRPEKAHGDLLHALQRLRRSGLPAKVLMIGDGVLRPAILRQIAELDLEGAAVIAGYRADVRPYIACCDVMTLTSHHETFSLAALESMSLGKAVVMTRIGGAEEQVTHARTGLLFAPGDLDALTEHLSVLADPQRSSKMGALASQFVRDKFAMQTMLTAFNRELLALADVPVGLTSPVPN